MKAVLAILVLVAASSLVCTRHVIEQDEPAPQHYQVLTSDSLEATVGKNQKGPQLIFFGATWCGHCRHFKPVFEEIGLLAQISHPELQLYHIDCARPDSKEACTKWDLPGYPTIYAAYKGNLCPLKGKRSVENVFAHLEACMDGTAEGMAAFPKTREEYNSFDKFYYGLVHYLDVIAGMVEGRPYVAIAVVVGGIAVFLLFITCTVSWLLDDDYSKSRRDSNEPLLSRKPKLE